MGVPAHPGTRADRQVLGRAWWGWGQGHGLSAGACHHSPAAGPLFCSRDSDALQTGARGTPEGCVVGGKKTAFGPPPSARCEQREDSGVKKGPAQEPPRASDGEFRAPPGRDFPMVPGTGQGPCAEAQTRCQERPLRVWSFSPRRPSVLTEPCPVPGTEEAERDSGHRASVPGGFPPTCRCPALRGASSSARHSGHSGAAGARPHTETSLDHTASRGQKPSLVSALGPGVCGWLTYALL